MDNKERKELFTKEDSYLLRGIAIIMVMASHYVSLCSQQLGNPQIEACVSELGKYGVDIFLLMSGYALVKTTAGRRVDLRFIWKRMKNTYLPYLIISGIIELTAGGEVTGRRIVYYFLGLEYWFVFLILVLYLAFFLIFMLVKKNGLRSGLLAVFTAAFSWCLSEAGYQAFWYVSNPAFVIGVCLGQRERKVLKYEKYWQPAGFVILAVLTGAAAYSGMHPGWIPETVAVWTLLLANVIWTLFIVCLPRLFLWHSRVLMFLGKISLYLYLFHVFLYFQVLNRFLEMEFAPRFLLTLAVTVGASWLLSAAWNGVFRLVERGKKTA